MTTYYTSALRRTEYCIAVDENGVRRIIARCTTEEDCQRILDALRPHTEETQSEVKP